MKIQKRHKNPTKNKNIKSREYFFSNAKKDSFFDKPFFQKINIQDTDNRDERKENAIRKAEDLSGQNDPCIWFDDWNDDNRDNNSNRLVDEKSEQGHNDGAHFWSGKPSWVCKDKSKKINECDQEELKKVNVQYRVCIDIPIICYRTAKIPFPTGTRDVDHFVKRLRNKPMYKELGWREVKDSSNLEGGDFVANDEHSGIVSNQGDIINLAHPNRDNPGTCNDLQRDGTLGAGGNKYVFRFKQPSKGNIITNLLSWILPDNQSDWLRGNTIYQTKDLIGLKKSDGITYGSWELRPKVNRLQAILNSFGFPCKVDGMFGNETERSLIAFQLENDIYPSAYVNEETAGALQIKKENPNWV